MSHTAAVTPGLPPLKLLICATLALALAACGGGGGNPGAVGGGGGTTTPGTGTAVGEPRLTVSVVDGSGASVNSLSGGQTGQVRVKLTDSTGIAASNAIVKFTASDAALVEFTPSSGSALTDATGTAVISVKPTSVTAAGAVAITAEGVVAGKTATGSVNLAVGAAPLTVGALTLTPAPAGKLPAFSTVAINIPVTSGGQPATSVPGLTLTSLCVGDGSATIVMGALANGVQTATYTNNGCLRGTDRITASIGNSSQSVNIDVDAANIGTMQFIGSDLQGTSIVLKGSGGLGRKEAAVLTFRVVDRNNNGLAGVDVNFRATTNTGGLTVLPASATTDATGRVTTTVSSGTIPTPVRVIAEATRNGSTISGLSDALTISTGLPIMKAMSISASSHNIEGGNYDGEKSEINIRLADQYGNPISDNTAVNFITEGGAVGTAAQGACTTKDGGCKVDLISQNFRPANGRVTVLAFVQGIENFTDLNGDGQYSCTSFVDANGAVPAVYRPLVDTCLSGGEPFADLSDPFLDTGEDGVYSAASGDLPIPYNSTVYRATGNGKWGINYISASTVIVFSESTPFLKRQVCTGDVCRDWATADGAVDEIAGVAGASCGARTLYFRLHDKNNNPLPENTSISGIDLVKLSLGEVVPASVPSSNAIGGTIHAVTVKPDSACASGSLVVKVTTPKGTAKTFAFKSQ
ncbi:Ig-like domain-containing protein [Massilia soli]|uniref:Ig-like domain-containing protein n=1 Tax=Massilia soli TaxID=2792854 RepID=A0ABS7SIK4_9BURK|nr:Ig-like domain-containing protein [Massilia soli]MBZ2205857.1 Ig-like domain-containing protein [Massilia soli]